MIMSRITAKSQTTVPQAVRRALGVGPGDRVGYEIEGNRVTLCRVPEISNDPFVNPFANFTEWASDADSAYDVLATR
jgi:antitoxin PrlF